jgi:hypothetical protein
MNIDLADPSPHRGDMNDTGTIDTGTIDTGTSAPRVPDDVPPTRQCGRCRAHFPIDADTHPMELRDWWACPNCVDALLPGRRPPTTGI